MPQDISGYDVGALLYCPANAHHTVAQAVAAERLPRPFSLALCLEDTVRADALAAAEQAVEQTLHNLTDAARQETFYRPLTFVRVRSPEQLAGWGGRMGSTVPAHRVYSAQIFYRNMRSLLRRYSRLAGGWAGLLLYARL